jgi:hypothetical protein
MKVVRIRIQIFSILQEVSSLRAFLSMQHPAQTPAINPNTLGMYKFQLFKKRNGTGTVARFFQSLP